MPTILVVEDDDAIRSNIVRLLRLEGHLLVAAPDGADGLAQARRVRPDVVISDIGMPGLDGFQLLEAIRAEPALAATAVMLLTALDDRASMRRGMTLGADDYLAKPFTRDELLDALAGLLRKKVRIERGIDAAVRAREEELQRAFSESIGGRKRPDRFGLEPPPGAVAERKVDATVLFADVRQFTSLAEKLASGEVAELLTEYFGRASAPVLRHGGRHLKFVGDGLVAVFEDDARGAIAAALGLTLEAHALRGWLAGRFGDRGLPPFAIGIGLHAGEVQLCRAAAAGGRDLQAVGDAVNAAARLESASKELGWTVVASSAVLARAGEGVETGAMTSLDVEGRTGFIDVAEVTGLAPGVGATAPGLGDTLDARADAIGVAVRVNSEITARAVKGALQGRLAALKEHSFAPGQPPLRLKGYRLTRKIGAGGMTEVVLAVREADGLPVVLKVLDAGGKAAGEHLARFIQEYTLLSRIAHPHVVRIYDQGFTDDHAYIAMEYFEHGDLRAELAAPMPQARALAVTRQVAQALGAIHARNVIHRDLKPGNIMRRGDGTVALADFGIAKSMLAADNVAFTHTRHGDVVGTPYYLSPEQASGGPITPASDLYSLGVMLFEMLAGRRPFRAESLDVLLARHLTAPVPRLPDEHAALQPVVERLMAKAPADRYPDAQALLDDLDRRMG